METKPKICIIGAGMYGTALSTVAAQDYKNNVVLYTIEADCVDDINKNHKNSKYHGDTILPSNITATLDLKEGIKGCTLILCALPVQTIALVLEKNKDIFDPNVPFVSCSKGMIVSKRKFVSECIKEIFGGKMKFCVLSGPSFAEEIIKKSPTLVVTASDFADAAELVQKTLSNQYFRIYRHDDVLGVEIAGALKNVIAIGAGIIEGAGYGYNTKTALVARGTKEMQKFAEKYGGKPHTLFGLAGIGDLMLTAFGELSRNRTFGFKLAKGQTKEQIVEESKGVVEGLPTLTVIMDYARDNNLDLPIISVIEEVVNGKISIEQASLKLMTRELTEEFPMATITK